MRSVAIALSVLVSIAAADGIAAAEPPPAAVTPLAKLNAWILPAEMRPLVADLDAGVFVVDGADARLSAINVSIGSLLGRHVAANTELGSARKKLADLRAEREMLPADDEDRAHALDAQIAAASSYVESLEKRVDDLYAAMHLLSDEAAGLMDGMMRAGEVASVVTDDPHTTSARKKKAAVLAEHAMRGYRARMQLVRTLMSVPHR